MFKVRVLGPKSRKTVSSLGAILIWIAETDRRFRRTQGRINRHADRF